MYYKVIKNAKVIDVLDDLRYCKYQMKHNLLLFCPKEEAQGIFSSDGQTAYHINTCRVFPIDDFPTVTLEEITKGEYNKLKDYHLMNAEQYTESILIELMQRGMM